MEARVISSSFVMTRPAPLQRFSRLKKLNLDSVRVFAAAKPGAKELVSIFEGRIADGTLALCDGLRSYHALPGIADCTARDCVN